MTDTQVVGGLFLVLGVGVFIGVAWVFALARGSTSWASAPGFIVSSKVDAAYGKRNVASTLYQVALRYEYQVNGETLTGRRIALGDSLWSSTRSRDKAEARRRKYPEGKDVTVFYDPARPGRCTLDRTFDAARYYWLFAVAFGLLAVGVAIFTGQIRVLH